MKIPFAIFCFLLLTGCSTQDVRFPTNDYDQNVSTWIPSTRPDYNQPLLTPALQNARMNELYEHDFASDDRAVSPWSEHFITSVLTAPPPQDIVSEEEHVIEKYTNDSSKTGDNVAYAQNDWPYSLSWINAIEANMDLSQFTTDAVYHEENRAIALRNMDARVLPTIDPVFYPHNFAQHRFPSDDLQQSAIWAGTPLYILGHTKEGAYDLVQAPSFIAWVDSRAIARVSPSFVSTWQTHARAQLAAIIQTKTPVQDQSGVFQFYAYVGSLFPVEKQDAEGLTILIPEQTPTGEAQIAFARLPSSEAAVMPLAPTPHNAAKLIATLQGRPYGWGNTRFYNDCSAELQNFFLPFGIWLPRHSSDQVNQGLMVDLSASSTEQRIAYLRQNGRPFFTIVYIGNHVFLFIGDYPDPKQPGASSVVMTYQNLALLPTWTQERLYNIDEAVFFPLLDHYPEDPSIVSLAGQTYFQVSFLDQFPLKQTQGSSFPH